MKDLTQFHQLQADLTLFVGPVKALMVTDKASCEKVTLTRRELRMWEKKIEEKRKELVGPLNEQVKRINEYVKQITAPLDEADAHLARQLLAFERELEKEREIQRQKEREEHRRREEDAQATIRAQREEAEVAAMFENDSEAARIKAQSEAEATRIAFEAQKAHWDASKDIKANKVSGATRRWTFIVDDPNLFPREYLILDDKAVKEAIRNGIRHIPGLKIFQETTISVR